MKKINPFLLAGIAFALLFIVIIVAVISTYKNTASEVTDAVKSKEVQSTYNILLLGKDSTAKLCDVMMLMSINSQSGDVNVLQIPRDTYFNFTDKSYKKINAAPRDLSTGDFVKSLSQSLGVNIDFYICMGLDTVSQMVDMMSGVEIDVPFDMEYNDPAQNLSISLKKGKQVLDGKSAIEFLRYRSGYATGDLGRMNAQKMFLVSFFKRLEEQNNLTNYYKMFKLILNNSEVNFNESDVMSVALKMSKNKNGIVTYATAPGEAVQSEQSGAWYYILSKPAMTELLLERFGLSNEQDFDKENKFVDKRNKSFYDIYNKCCEYKLYTTDDIENNMIDIN